MFALRGALKISLPRVGLKMLLPPRGGLMGPMTGKVKAGLKLRLRGGLNPFLRGGLLTPLLFGRESSLLGGVYGGLRAIMLPDVTLDGGLLMVAASVLFALGVELEDLDYGILSRLIALFATGQNAKGREGVNTR